MTDICTECGDVTSEWSSLCPYCEEAETRSKKRPTCVTPIIEEIAALIDDVVPKAQAAVDRLQTRLLPALANATQKMQKVIDTMEEEKGTE